MNVDSLSAEGVCMFFLATMARTVRRVLSLKTEENVFE
jgi:hypothetical protein